MVVFLVGDLDFSSCFKLNLVEVLDFFFLVVGGRDIIIY